MLLSIYEKREAALKPQLSTDKSFEQQKRQKVILRIGRPESVASSTRFTESTNAKIQSRAEERRRIRFEAALKKIARFRDQPSRITEQDTSDFLQGPPEQVEYHKSQLGSIKKFTNFQKSSSKKQGSTNSESDRVSFFSLNSDRNAENNCVKVRLNFKSGAHRRSNSLSVLSTRSADESTKTIIDRFYKKQSARNKQTEIEPIFERLRRPKTSKQTKEESEAQQKGENLQK